MLIVAKWKSFVKEFCDGKSDMVLIIIFNGIYENFLIKYGKDLGAWLSG